MRQLTTTLCALIALTTLSLTAVPSLSLFAQHEVLKAQSREPPISDPATTVASSHRVLPPPNKPSSALTLTTIARLANDPTIQSVQGRDFHLFKTAHTSNSSNPKPYRFLVQGGIHGNEATASKFVTWMARRYARGESLLNELPADSVEIDFLPYANPDGSAQKTRYNSQGVNLNRNFAVLWGLTRENPGTASFSEPETRAIQTLFKHRSYTAAVDVHGYINWIVAPSSPEDASRLDNRTPPKGIKAFKQRYKSWLSALKSQMRILPGYQLKTAGGLGDGGAFEDWAFWSHGTMAYCLELETFQRFIPQYRRDFADITRDSPGARIDLFARYEAFVYTMFNQAIEIRKAEETPQNIASGH